jgi:PST family polysaccharide transporter
LGLATLAGPVVALLYGRDWSAAAAPLIGLAIFGGLRVLLDLTATFLIALGHTRDVLVVQLLWLAAMVPAMLIGVGRFGLSGAGWAHVVVAAGLVGPAYLVCLRRLGGRPVALIRAIAVPVVAAIPAAVVCAWIGGLSAPPVLLIGIGAVLGVVLYAAPTAPLWWRTVTQVRSPGAEAAT